MTNLMVLMQPIKLMVQISLTELKETKVEVRTHNLTALIGYQTY